MADRIPVACEMPYLGLENVNPGLGCLDVARNVLIIPKTMPQNMSIQTTTMPPDP